MPLPFGKFVFRPLGNFVVSTFVAQPLSHRTVYMPLSLLDVINCGLTRAILFTVDTNHPVCPCTRRMIQRSRYLDATNVTVDIICLGPIFTALTSLLIIPRHLYDIS